MAADTRHRRGGLRVPARPRCRARLHLLPVRRPDPRCRVAGASAQFPSIELYAQTSDAARAAQAGFDGVRMAVRRVRRARCLRWLLQAGHDGPHRLRAVGRAGLQRNSRHAGPPRAQPPGRRHVRRHVRGRRSPPTPTESRSPATTSGTRAPRSSHPATGADDLRRVRELRGSVRPQGQGGRAGVLCSHGALDGDVRVAAAVERAPARVGLSALDHPERHEAGDATGEPGLLDDAHHSLDVLVGEGASSARPLGEGQRTTMPLLELAAQCSRRSACGQPSAKECARRRGTWYRMTSPSTPARRRARSSPSPCSRG